MAPANAPLRIRPCRSCRTRIVHGRKCRAMPRRMVRPKVGSPAWPLPTMDLADPDRAGLTVSTRSPGGLPAEPPGPSRGRRVVRENDPCSPLRRSTPATPPPRRSAISSSLSMLGPCRNVRRNDEQPRRFACNQLPTPPRRREQAPGRSPRDKRGMVLMGAHVYSGSPAAGWIGLAGGLVPSICSRRYAGLRHGD